MAKLQVILSLAFALSAVRCAHLPATPPRTAAWASG